MDTLDLSLFDPARGIHVVRVDIPQLLAAEARAEQLVTQAQLNEAIALIRELEAEVAEMPIASRFRTDRKPANSPHLSDDERGQLRPLFGGLNEPEFKRQQILRDLRWLKHEIAATVANLRTIVMDIEATKTEG